MSAQMCVILFIFVRFGNLLNENWFTGYSSFTRNVQIVLGVFCFLFLSSVHTQKTETDQQTDRRTNKRQIWHVMRPRPPHSNADQLEISVFRNEKIGVQDSRVDDDDVTSSTSRSIKYRSLVSSFCIAPCLRLINAAEY